LRGNMSPHDFAKRIPDSDVQLMRKVYFN